AAVRLLGDARSVGAVLGRLTLAVEGAVPTARSGAGAGASLSLNARAGGRRPRAVGLERRGGRRSDVAARSSTNHAAGLEDVGRTRVRRAVASLSHITHATAHTAHRARSDLGVARAVVQRAVARLGDVAHPASHAAHRAVPYL